MKNKSLILGLAFLLTQNMLSSQSLESQLKIIFGDVLSTYGKNDFSRIIGKALSTSGQMKYTVELIQARNSQNIIVNIPMNTHLDGNNQITPNIGFQWLNPNDPTDFRLVASANGPTLQPYALDQLGREFDKFTIMASDFILGPLFTYNWYSDFDGDKSVTFGEFNGVKRTFRVMEPVCFAYKYHHNGKRTSRNPLIENIQIFNAATGALIAQDQKTYTGPKYSAFYGSYKDCLGNNLPVGKYLITINNNYVGTIKEYFEVIE